MVGKYESLELWLQGLLKDCREDDRRLSTDQ